MGKNKNRHNNEVVEVEVTEEMNLPAEQDDSTEEIQNEEEKEMDSKKVRRNLLQWAGDGLKAAGDWQANVKAKHPIGTTVGKVGLGLAAAGGVAVAIVSAVKNGKADEEVADTYEDEDLEYYDEDLDDEDLEVTEDSTSEETTETTEE